ncbi:ABC transporter substrate-binding protein [Nocardioides aequoreus]|uniref:ABC transporter substrate-binding protein n=1 Tax=Nocardioides aequoreus TaxID=397278 RepID=UPI0004C398C4|nr:ABC transporter substrate-binding protein [Nocardioides aequoreus]
MTRRPLMTIGAAVASLALLAGCGGGGGEDAFSEEESDAGTIVIGSANFPENVLLMNMYAAALEDAGVTVETKPEIGAREVYMQALEDGSIDLLPEYNGALLAFLAAGQDQEVPRDVTSPEDVYDALQDVLPEGTETLPQSEAEDKDTLTVTQETAEEYDLTSIADLEPVAGDLVVGAGPEFRDRFQGLVGLEEVYGLTFKEFKPLDVGGPLTVNSLKDGSIDVGNIFSTDSSIETEGFVVLEDPENLYTSQNITPLIRSDKLTPEAEEALNAVSEALTTENLTEALARVQVDKDDPSVVAQEFLEQEGVIGG